MNIVNNYPFIYVSLGKEVNTMEFASPSLTLVKRNLTRDEWWYIPVIFFILRVYNTHQLNAAVEKCENRGGVAKVSEAMFGSTWSVKCIKK